VQHVPAARAVVVVAGDLDQAAALVVTARGRSGRLRQRDRFRSVVAERCAVVIGAAVGDLARVSQRSGFVPDLRQECGLPRRRVYREFFHRGIDV